MKRKRVTDLFPFLIPIRKRQRCAFFYAGMALDKNRYAKTKEESLYPHQIFSAESAVINEESGFDIKYQYNKAHNLSVALTPVDRIVIRPGEVFSFWQLVRKADAETPYKEALSLLHGKMSTADGGGLCQLSNMLFWLFLHTPLTIVERHPHSTEFFSTEDGEIPPGADATISEGWLDLKVKNITKNTFQIVLYLEEGFLKGRIYAAEPLKHRYEISDRHRQYYYQGNDIYRENDIFRKTIDRKTGTVIDDVRLYHSKSLIKYPLDESITVLEKRIERGGKLRNEKENRRTLRGLLNRI